MTAGIVDSLLRLLESPGGGVFLGALVGAGVPALVSAVTTILSVIFGEWSRSRRENRRERKEETKIFADAFMAMAEIQAVTRSRSASDAPAPLQDSVLQALRSLLRRVSLSGNPRRGDLEDAVRRLYSSTMEDHQYGSAVEIQKLIQDIDKSHRHQGLLARTWADARKLDASRTASLEVRVHPEVVLKVFREEGRLLPMRNEIALTYRKLAPEDARLLFVSNDGISPKNTDEDCPTFTDLECPLNADC